MSFYLSKILWLIFNPFNFILFLIFLGIVTHLIFNNIFHKLFYFFAVIIFIIAAVMPTGKFMIFKLEKNFHTQTIIPSQIDGILILSGATDPILTKEYNQISLIISAFLMTFLIRIMIRLELY